MRVSLDVHYDVDRIESALLPIDRLRVKIANEQGWLTIDPLVTGLAEGAVIGFASIDGTQSPPASEFDIRIEGLQLQDLLAKLDMGSEGFGGIDGRIG